MIDATARVASSLSDGRDITVGPWCSLGMDGPLRGIEIGTGACVRSHTVIYGGVQIGERFHSGHGVLIRQGTRIANDCSVGSHSVIEHDVELEDGVRVHSRCFVPELCVLRRGCWLGPGVILTNAKYPNRAETKGRLRGVEIGEGAVLGAGVVVLPGVRIGAGSMIGAGAVVTKNVPGGALVVGNPAREAALGG